jgi:DNA-binding MarR family transcriptional regulator
MTQFVHRAPYWINRAAFAFRTELQQAFSADGIDVTPEEWALLMVLAELHPLSVGKLADLTLRDRTTVTRLLDGMERKKLITKTSDESDRRRTLVRLTRESRKLHPRLLHHVEALIQRGTDGIAPEHLVLLQSVLEKMVRNLFRTDQTD